MRLRREGDKCNLKVFEFVKIDRICYAVSIEIGLSHLRSSIWHTLLENVNYSLPIFTGWMKMLFVPIAINQLDLSIQCFQLTLCKNNLASIPEHLFLLTRLLEPCISSQL